MDKTTTDAYKMLEISKFIPSSGYASEGSNLFTSDTWGNVKDIGGSNIQNLIKQVYQSAENVKQAEDAFKKVVEEDKQLREILGLSGDGDSDTTTTTKTYAEAYKSARDRYLALQKEVAKMEKEKNKYSEQDYKNKKADLEAAKKEYEALGGVTSTKALSEKQKNAKEAAKIAQDIVNGITQAEIDAMEDGSEKKKKQIEFDYEKELQAIQEQEAELRAAQNGKLTQDQETSLANLRSAAEAKKTKKTEDIDKETTKAGTAAMDEYLIAFGTFQQKKLALTRKYGRLIDEAKTAGEKKTLTAERDAMLAEYSYEAAEYAKSLVELTTKELNTMLQDTKIQLEGSEALLQTYENLESDEAKALIEDINLLKAYISKLEAELGKAGRQVKDDNWAEATQVFQSIASSAREAADSIAVLDENLAYMLRSMADLAGVTTNITAAMKAFDEAEDSVGKLSGILAIIVSAIQAISYIANSFNENAEATQRATDALRAYNAELARINNANISESYSSIFGKDKYGEFSARLKAVQEYSKALEDIKNGASKEVDYGWYMTSKERQDYNLRSQVGVMDNTTFIADMRSGWQKFWGTGKDNIKTTSIDEFYENGVLNVDKLKAYYDTYKEYLTDEQKLLIEELISNGELMQENLDALNAYMSDIFGEMGQSISDALVDAFQNGTDAAEAMGEAVSDVLEQIVEDIAFSQFLQPILDDLDRRVDELNARKAKGELTDEEYLDELLNIVSDGMDQAIDAKDDALAFYQRVKDRAAEKGVTLFGDESSSSSASSAGFQTMSQEIGSELNGRFTDIQGQTHRIAEAVEFCKSLHIENLTQVQSINATVAMIHNDTSLIEQHTRALAQMRDDLASIRRSVDNGAI